MANETEPLSQILERSGIFHHIAGQTLEEVILDALQRISLPQEVDTHRILTAILERETLASSAIGKGLAIPHCRDASLVALPVPLVSLNCLQTALCPWGTDWSVVSAFFLILCPNATIHLRVVSKLSSLLRKDEFRQLIGANASSEAILDFVRACEQPAGIGSSIL
jgi:PTS system nitrogen regulatory IIA component